VDESALPTATPEVWRGPLRSVHVTRVADESQCDWVVRAAEAHAASLGGWDGTGHHDYHPTNDVVVADSKPLREWLQAKLDDVIWPALGAQFGVAPEELWLEDAFIIRYESAESGQSGLGMHTDDSELSFTILLSDPNTFEGGGTTFEAASNLIVTPAQGQMVSHFGRLRHAGNPVSEGVRYILAGFVRCQPMAKAWRVLREPPNSRVGWAGIS